MGDNALEQIQYLNKNNITVHIMSRVLWWNSVLWYSPQRMGDNAEGQTVARRRYKSRANSQMGTNREKMEHGPKYIWNKHNVSVHA